MGLVAPALVGEAKLGAGTESGQNRGAAEQRDEADEGRVEAERSMVSASCHGVAATKDGGGGARPSQLIASVLRTSRERRVTTGLSE